MLQKLDEYERNEQIDQWSIYFTVGKKYNFNDLQDVRNSHAW